MSIRMNFSNTITNIFIQSSVIYRNFLEKKLEPFQLHSGQIFILISLWETDGQSQNDLAKKLKVSAPTINKMVKSLAKNSFIECRNCDIDGRVVKIFLTRKGKDVEPKIEEIWSEMEDLFLLNFTEPEKMILHQLMEKTFNNLIS
ncbi:MAG: MarR family transcriptional regulator [Pyrinomonadaceae bacterium]|nr:MarR family transcriptional regulator [Pyrinomonadaceae bacterium]